MHQPNVSPSQSRRSHYRVGDLLVDVGQARVSRDTIDIPLPKLSFDLFVALIEGAPNIVTVDVLMERVWPGLVVSPETVSQRVKLLRDALNDDAKQPRYIAGVRGRGYRLIAGISAVGDEEPKPSAEGRPESKARTAGWIAAVVALAIVAIFAAMQRDTSRDTPAQLEPPIPVNDRSIAVLPFENLSASTENDVLALGISETLLHRLASLRPITVIARTSSFAFRGKPLDAREIGRKLHVRYLLEGSVQTEAQRLRVTAQLIDTSTSAHVWSMQFDRSRGDIFAVQDEIALQVAKALAITLDPRLTQQLTGQGTADFEAYLAFMQARALVTTLRMNDLQSAVGHLERSIQRDPNFASAYVLLAGTQVLLAEYEISKDRQQRFQQALTQGYTLIEKALVLDDANADAYVQRGYLNAFSDLAAAEADYRHGLELQPSNARAYEGLASILFQDPKRLNETQQMLSRARELDPLEPRYDVTQSVLLFYGRSDCAGADRYLKAALTKNPLFQPAMMRLAEVRWVCGGRFAEAIDYGEQALALDSRSEWTRRLLARSYLDTGDASAARALINSKSHDIRGLPLYLYRREWKLAGEIAYRAIAEGSATALDEQFTALAVRMHARETGDYARAVAALESWSGVSWGERGGPFLRQQFGMKSGAVALADVLQHSGDERRARAILDAVLTDMDYEAKDLGRGELWYFQSRASALALMGQTEAALAHLERGFAQGSFQGWFTVEIEPAFQPLRSNARFSRLLDGAKAHAAAEDARLKELRSKGSVPDRSKQSD